MSGDVITYDRVITFLYVEDSTTTVDIFITKVSSGGKGGIISGKYSHIDGRKSIYQKLFGGYNYICN